MSNNVLQPGEKSERKIVFETEYYNNNNFQFYKRLHVKDFL